jgi:hypothetical protein
MAQVSVVGPDGGESIQLGPTLMRILEDGPSTGHRLGVGEITLAPHTDLSSAGGRAEQGADGALDVADALFCVRDVEGGLEFRADRDPAGG